MLAHTLEIVRNGHLDLDDLAMIHRCQTDLAEMDGSDETTTTESVLPAVLPCLHPDRRETLRRTVRESDG